jgi:hypothetical protein
MISNFPEAVNFHNYDGTEVEFGSNLIGIQIFLIGYKVRTYRIGCSKHDNCSTISTQHNGGAYMTI